MIKLKRKRTQAQPERFYLIQRMDSVSPDYIGLQVTFGRRHRRGRTHHYWFKRRHTPTGRLVTADKQLLRKVRALVKLRLRGGYEVRRKCDEWCRFTVDNAQTAYAVQKEAPRLPRRKPKAPYTPSLFEVVAGQKRKDASPDPVKAPAQMVFDFI